MTSALNSIYTGINTQFPVAGVDNDTQVFRDNFTAIYNSFNEAYNNIVALQQYSALKNTTCDFGLNQVTNATLINNKVALYDNGIIANSTAPINCALGDYQLMQIAFGTSLTQVTLSFTNLLPYQSTANLMSKVRLLITSSTSSGGTIVFTPPAGLTVKYINVGTPSYITVTSNSNPLIFDVWQHYSSQTGNATFNGNMFVSYVGQAI
jgi:hypothetical protein